MTESVMFSILSKAVLCSCYPRGKRLLILRNMREVKVQLQLYNRFMF